MDFFSIISTLGTALLGTMGTRILKHMALPNETHDLTGKMDSEENKA